MDVFAKYKPFRNKISLLAREDALRVIWAYCQYLQIDDFTIPNDIEMDNCVREAIEKARATVRYRQTSIQSRCLTANSRHSCAKWLREPFRVSTEQSARLSHGSVLKNVPTISDMQAMLQYDRNPL
jgi:hypothetical protein